jgi:hypothetical protein
VTDITDVHGTELWMNGGYFVFRQEIFDYIGEGEDLVAEPFQRLIDDDQLLAYRYEGSGCRWTRSRTFRTSRPFTTAARSHGPHGAPPRRDNARRAAFTCLASGTAPDGYSFTSAARELAATAPSSGKCSYCSARSSSARRPGGSSTSS